MTDPCQLPGVLAEIEEVAGRKAALRLALAMGGAELRVPRPETISEEHCIAQAVGVEHARAIAGRFCGECLYVPMARRALVTYLFEDGSKVPEIAAQLGLSRQTVRRYRRGK